MTVTASGNNPLPSIAASLHLLRLLVLLTVESRNDPRVIAKVHYHNHVVSTCVARGLCFIFTILSCRNKRLLIDRLIDHHFGRRSYFSENFKCRVAVTEGKQGSYRPQTPPRCFHLGSHFKRPKSSVVRPLACNCAIDINAHSL